jgi:DNA modification methylase
MDKLQIICGDALTKLRELPSESAQCCVTSPPYWGLRDYGNAAQLGLEKTPEEYVARMVEIFREVRRVLRKDGTLWLNLGDSYASAWSCNRRNVIGQGACEPEKRMRRGSGRADGIVTDESPRNRDGTPRPEGLKEKDLIGIPWRVAFTLQADGWWLRQDIIWNKPNPMPESVTDRCTKSHEYIFLLTKSAKYFYDYMAILEAAAYDGRMDTEYKGGPKDMSCGAHERWPNKMALPNTFKGSLPGRKGGPGQDRRSDNDRIAYNQKGDNYGPNGQAFNQMHAVDGVPARNKRSVWTVTTQPYPDAHFATYPPDLIKPCIMAGSRVSDTVLDPFAGSGTTGAVALELGRKAILIELNPKYIKLIEQRCNVTLGLPF